MKKQPNILIIGFGSIDKRHYRNLRALGYKDPAVFDVNKQALQGGSFGRCRMLEPSISKSTRLFLSAVPITCTCGMPFSRRMPGVKQEIIGLRAGEKRHEILLTDQESRRAMELSKYFVILPEFPFWSVSKRYRAYLRTGKKIDGEFCYDSKRNREWLTKNQLRELIKPR